jgi:serine/threonine protein kinase
MSGATAPIPHEVGDYIFLSPRSEFLWVGSNTQTQEQVLIRVIPKHHNEAEIARVNAATAAHRQIIHHLIAKFHDVIEDDDFLFVITDAPGSKTIRQWVTEHGPVPAIKIQEFLARFADLSDAISRVESASFRLTIDSVFVDDECSLAQAHLDLASVTMDLRFQAPEVIARQEFTHASIVWTAAVFLYFMAVGNLPFEGSNDDEIKRSVLHTQPDFPEEVDEQLAGLIRKMLVKNPMTRTGWGQMGEQPWLKSASPHVKDVFVTLSHPGAKSSGDIRHVASGPAVGKTRSSNLPHFGGEQVRIQPKKSFGSGVVSPGPGRRPPSGGH